MGENLDEIYIWNSNNCASNRNSVDQKAFNNLCKQFFDKFKNKENNQLVRFNDVPKTLISTSIAFVTENFPEKLKHSDESLKQIEEVGFI